jgi:hypothetical protein
MCVVAANSVCSPHVYMRGLIPVRAAYWIQAAPDTADNYTVYLLHSHTMHAN